MQVEDGQIAVTLLLVDFFPGIWKNFHIPVF
jgi:hypothetical protein